MLLEIAISTNKKNINSIVEKINNLSDRNHYILYTIIWQNNRIKTQQINVGKNVRVLIFNEIGLSKSRNRALEFAIGDILLFSDDDIIFEGNIYKKITKAYRELPDADIITFKAYTIKNGLKVPFKSYPNKILKHNLRTIMRVSSWEITCKPKRILEKNVKFNELFGLGSKYPSSEENLFLYDAIKNGLNVYFYPEFIVTHPTETTSTHTFSSEVLKSKGAFFYEVFGKLSYAIIPLFSFKKIREFPNIFKSLFYMYKGLYDYKNLVKNK